MRRRLGRKPVVPGRRGSRLSAACAEDPSLCAEGPSLRFRYRAGRVAIAYLPGAGMPPAASHPR
jgi:hypothetical protein